MLLEPPSTAWDLRWRMFGVPVRVHPLFWLVILIFGQSALDRGPLYLFIWIVCASISLLIHEFGHVLMGMAFGARGHIVLYAFGGLAIGSNNLSRPGQRIAVSLAGPGAQFVFLALVFVVLFLRNTDDVAYLSLLANSLGIPIPPSHGMRLRFLLASRPFEFAAVSYLIFTNVFWGLMNLLPIWPLDGGQVSRELCQIADRRQGLVISLVISTAVAAMIAAVSLLDFLDMIALPVRFGSPYLSLMFGYLAYQSYSMYAQITNPRPPSDDRF